MIFNRDYFVKGEVEGAIVVTAKNYSGEVEEVRSYTGSNEGKYILTLAWDSGRESKQYETFSKALTMANGYWARQSLWLETADGKRKRLLRWQ